MEKESIKNEETPISSQEIAEVKKYHDKVEEERSPSHRAPLIAMVAVATACVVGIISFLVYYFFPLQKMYFTVTLVLGLTIGFIFVVLFSKRILKKKNTGLMAIPLYEAKGTPLTTLTPNVNDDEGAPSYSINVQAPEHESKKEEPTVVASAPQEIKAMPSEIQPNATSPEEDKKMDEIKEIKTPDEVTISVDSVDLDDDSLIDRAPKHEMSLSDFDLAFKNAFLEGGFQLKDSSLHELASSLAFSRLFFLTKIKKEDQEGLISCLSSFFGGESLFLEAFDPSFLTIDSSPLLHLFLKAQANPNSYYFVGISDVDSSFNDSFASLMGAVEFPSEKNSFVGANGEEAIPSNIIFIAFKKDDVSPFRFSDTFLRYSPFLSLRYARGEKKVRDEDTKPLSIHDFSTLILHAKKNFYLSEQDWQKIDSFEELMQKKHRYVLEYKIRDWMENSLSLLLGLGESEALAMDFSFGKVILPFGLSKLQAPAIQGDDGVEGFVERNLGDGETTFSNEIIKERLHFLTEEAIRLEKEKKEEADKKALEEAQKQEEATKEAAVVAETTPLVTSPTPEVTPSKEETATVNPEATNESKDEKPVASSSQDGTKPSLDSNDDVKAEVATKETDSSNQVPAEAKASKEDKKKVEPAPKSKKEKRKKNG
jgi:hypothetical protein